MVLIISLAYGLKDPVLLQLWLRLQLQLRSDPWPRNFHIQWIWPKKKNNFWYEVLYLYLSFETGRELLNEKKMMQLISYMFRIHFTLKFVYHNIFHYLSLCIFLVSSFNSYIIRKLKKPKWTNVWFWMQLRIYIFSRIYVYPVIRQWFHHWLPLRLTVLLHPNLLLAQHGL